MTIIIRFFLLSILLAGCHQGYIKPLQYPNTKKDVGVTDTYFTTTVADPYRWLEDDNSAETEIFLAMPKARVAVTGKNFIFMT